MSVNTVDNLLVRFFANSTRRKREEAATLWRLAVQLVKFCKWNAEMHRDTELHPEVMIYRPMTPAGDSRRISMTVQMWNQAAAIEVKDSLFGFVFWYCLELNERQEPTVHFYVLQNSGDMFRNEADKDHLLTQHLSPQKRLMGSFGNARDQFVKMVLWRLLERVTGVPASPEIYRDQETLDPENLAEKKLCLYLEGYRKH